VRQGGVIILAAECREGFGNQIFEAWMTEGRSPDERLERIQKRFVLGGHKAAAVATVQKRCDVYLVSALPGDLVRRCGLTPFEELNTAVESALGRLGNNASLLVMPQGGSILPVREP
jgi:nickel-dependent lactate racemase